MSAANVPLNKMQIEILLKLIESTTMQVSGNRKAIDEVLSKLDEIQNILTEALQQDFKESQNE